MLWLGGTELLETIPVVGLTILSTGFQAIKLSTQLPRGADLHWDESGLLSLVYLQQQTTGETKY